MSEHIYAIREAAWGEGYDAAVAASNEARDILRDRISKLESALAPFAEFAVWVDDNGWTSTIHREPISTWFGPSDFRNAILAMKKVAYKP